MAVLPQLADPGSYRPCDWDLRRDAEGRAYWIEHFCRHLEVLTPLMVEECPEGGASRLEAFRREYRATMQGVAREPERYQRVDILLLDELRQELLTRFGFDDPFQRIKRCENDAALETLPGLLAELDDTPAGAQLEKLVLGLMAGNLFDLGALAAVARYRSQKLDFRQTRASQPARPWRIDDLDAWQERWQAGAGYCQVLFFVDNAGSDICLGCLPLVRWMVRMGARVTLAANSGAALNDVTAPELASLLERIRVFDNVIEEALDSGHLAVIASGNHAPLLDLTALSPECATHAHDADLIILLGMGRAVESNWQARFRCDAVWTAVLKDAAVARRVGGRLFDCVFRYRPTGQG